jgi:regulator-associated protein of mTOR
MMNLVVQMKTGCVALVLCLNISVDPPDVIKFSPCARMECWIGKSVNVYSSMYFQISN